MDALRTGVEKQESRVAEAKAAYEAALKSGTDNKPTEATEATATKPDAEQLQKKLLAQKDRVEKARERLEMARAEKLDSVDALEKALNKQLEKLAAFEAQTSTTGEV